MQQPKLKGTYASINLDHIVHNYKEACRLTGNEVTVSCVVKSDAYGHGEKQIVQVLVENGLFVICVGTINEALRLRSLFPKIDILILGYTPKCLVSKIYENNLIQSIGTIEEAKNLSAVGQCKVHLKINTGMNRLGFSLENIKDILAVNRLNNIDICGIFTHLHSSDSASPEPTQKQFEQFDNLLEKLDSKGVRVGTKHVCNSGGVMAFPNMHLDMVRAGIMIYGLFPSKTIGCDIVQLKECMELRSYVAQIIDVKKGGGISYSHTYVATQNMKIATINLGYSDGVFRHLSNKGEVIINDQRCPIVGTVCMNLIVVDITGMDTVRVEDEVILFGRSENQFISIDEVAQWAGTISYEIICRTGYCAPRVYYKNGKIVECEDNLLIETTEYKA